jgi:hypothetical protein
MDLKRLYLESCVGALAIAIVAITACTSSTTRSSVVAPSSDKCAVTVTSSPSTFTAAGGSGSATISASRDCSWSIAADSSWVSIAAARDGQGEAVVPFSVAPNPVPSARSAAITVGSQRAPLSQAAASCTFSLSSTSGTAAAAGGALSVNVSTLNGCSWTASSTADWVAVTGGKSGTSSGAVTASVAANTGGARVGTMNIAGQTYTVKQDAASGPDPAPPNPPPAPNPPPPPPPPPPDGGQPVEIDGIVLAVFARCPAASFLVLTTTVTTNNDTDYKGGHCDDITPLRSVDVTGQRQSDGSVLANRVNFKKDH